MRTTEPGAAAPLRPAIERDAAAGGSHHAARLSPALPGQGGALYGQATHGWMSSFRRAGLASRLPGLYLAGGSVHPGPGVPMAALSGQLAAATLMAHLDSTSRSRRVAISGGTSTRVSDDGRHGLTIIAFVGSVFSPYYAWARARDRAAAGRGPLRASTWRCTATPARRWTMTERGRASVSRDAHEFVVGPSRLHWDGASLVIDIDEIGMPLPRRVRGRVRVWPRGAVRPSSRRSTTAARHRWGPIAPCARVEVELEQPGAALERPRLPRLATRATSRSTGRSPSGTGRAPRCADGSTAVIYDVRQKQRRRPRASRCASRADGAAEPFEPPPRQALPRTAVAHRSHDAQRAGRAGARAADAGGHAVLRALGARVGAARRARDRRCTRR